MSGAGAADGEWTLSIGEPPTKNLWETAFDQLKQEDVETLEPLALGLQREATVATVKSTLESMLAEKKKKAWKFKFNGKEIIITEVVYKILEWVDKYKMIGDIAVQYEAGHASLPWAAFRFILQEGLCPGLKISS